MVIVKRLTIILTLSITVAIAAWVMWPWHRPAPTVPAIQIAIKAPTSFFKTSFESQIPAIEGTHGTDSCLLQLNKTTMCLVNFNYAVVRLPDRHFAVNASFSFDHGIPSPTQYSAKTLPVHPSGPQVYDWTPLTSEFEAVAYLNGSRIAR